MEKLDKILASYTAQGDETVGKVLGAAFVVTDRNGKHDYFAQADQPVGTLTVSMSQEPSIPVLQDAWMAPNHRRPLPTTPTHGLRLSPSY